MTTIFQSGPGLYAAETPEGNASVAPGTMRVYCARIEAYDLSASEQSDMDTSFHILFAKAENDPRIARALLKLGDTIAVNRTQLEGFAS